MYNITVNLRKVSVNKSQVTTWKCYFVTNIYVTSLKALIKAELSPTVFKCCNLFLLVNRNIPLPNIPLHIPLFCQGFIFLQLLSDLFLFLNRYSYISVRILFPQKRCPFTSILAFSYILPLCYIWDKFLVQISSKAPPPSS
jgi:hypothetical protein